MLPMKVWVFYRYTQGKEKYLKRNLQQIVNHKSKCRIKFWRQCVLNKQYTIKKKINWSSQYFCNYYSTVTVILKDEGWLFQRFLYSTSLPTWNVVFLNCSISQPNKGRHLRAMHLNDRIFIKDLEKTSQFTDLNIIEQITRLSSTCNHVGKFQLFLIL